MSIEARQIQETHYSYAAILNFTPSPQGLRAKFGACSVQNAQLLTKIIQQETKIVQQETKIIQGTNKFNYTCTTWNYLSYVEKNNCTANITK